MPSKARYFSGRGSFKAKRTPPRILACCAPGFDPPSRGGSGKLLGLLKLPDQPEQQRYERAHQQAGDDGEIEVAMLAADDDVTGQPTKPKARQSRPKKADGKQR